MKTLKTIGYAVGLPALLVLAWWALTASSTSFWVPKPLQLLNTFIKV